MFLIGVILDEYALPYCQGKLGFCQDLQPKCDFPEPSSISISTFIVENAVLLYFRNAQLSKIVESAIFDQCSCAKTGTQRSREDRKLAVGDLKSPSMPDIPGAVFGKPARNACIPAYFVVSVWRPGCVGRKESADEADLVCDTETKCEAQ